MKTALLLRAAALSLLLTAAAPAALVPALAQDRVTEPRAGLPEAPREWVDKDLSLIHI